MGTSHLTLQPERFLTEGPIPHSRVSEVTGEWAQDHRIGGVVDFTGVVRADETAAGRVRAIEFTAHRNMAERSLREIAERTAGGYEAEVLRVHLQHALGTVAVGEVPLVVVVGAAHRAEAFELCREIVEALKAEVPIYGKELTEDGDHTWKVNT